MSEGELKKRIRIQFEDECTTDFDGFVAPIIDEAKKEFLAIYPEEELGGTLQRWIQSLEELLVVEEKTAKRIGATLRPDKYRLLRTLKWFVKYFVDSEG